MTTANRWTLVAGLGSALVAIGGDADLVPDGKLKHAMVAAGAAGALLSGVFARKPQLRPTPVGPAPGLISPALLQPGDVLLYSAVGIYGLIIERKTWHPISHNEVFIGGGQSVASRDRIGTGRYPLRLSDLALVCRPRVPFDLPAALRWFETTPHRPYGFLDLLQFIGFNVQSGGVVCSVYATEFMRSGGLDPFNGEPARLVVPFEFLLSNCFEILRVTPDGSLTRQITEVVHA